MSAVVSNTSPICYLLLIGQVDLLPTLFGRVVIPKAVRDELASEDAPEPVRSWIAQPPDWLDIRDMKAEPDSGLSQLHRGEQEAILLAEELMTDLIILDEKAARQTAMERGLNLTGLIGILDESATRGLIDLPLAVERLRQTNFRISPRLLKSLLDRHLAARSSDEDQG